MKKRDSSNAVIRIASLAGSAGGRALLVGGCVRDRLLGTVSKDFDLEIYGLPAEEIVRALTPEFVIDPVGMSFGVFKVHGFDIDIALPRVENKTGAGHRGFMVKHVPGLGFAEASARRDFTVNAIMQDPLTGEIIDPHNGRDDLANGVLRHISSHFAEDPLRVLRAMQFAARLEFRVAPETAAVCSTLRQDELPCERVGAEWEKLLLKGRKPSLGLAFLRDCGWIKYYPELECMINCPQNPEFHPEGDVWNHTLAVADAAALLRSGNDDDDLVLMLGALCHDMGKPASTFCNEQGRIVSPGHDRAGLAAAGDFINRIWRRNYLPGKVLPLVACHMNPVALILNRSSDKAFRRMALEVGRMDLLAALAESDVRGTAGSPDEQSRKLALIEAFRQKTHELAVAGEPPKPLVQGRDLIREGIRPGPEMGRILNRCFEAQLDGRFSDVSGGLEFLKKAGLL